MLEALSGDMRGTRLDPSDPKLRQYLIASMGGLADERLRLLFLDGGRRLIADEEFQRGSLSQLALYPRTIFRRALELNAAGIILVHNHPSGDPAPSEADVEVTRRLDQIGRTLDIEIIDHIIVTSAYAHHIVSRQTLGGTDVHRSSLTLRSPTLRSAIPWPRPEISAAALANARIVTHRRLLRQQLIGAPELFGDPAWEMLVDLFLHEGQGKDLSIGALCVPVGLPTSSALRLVQKLCDADILQRIDDPVDGRRSIIRLAPAISHRLRAYFEAGAD